MKNLKKVLAFMLVAAMMVSMAVSASALSAKDFTDYDEIVNTDAVAMLTELKIINGYPTGDYQPSGIVTRAEMAKMIYTALMGGSDSAPVNTTNKYSDVWSGMWCEGYVAFCDELGIIEGYGDGTFGPNDPVTGVQAAKMLLVAMGYDSAKEGFSSDAQWNYNILKVASAKGLFEGFEADTSAGCTRDNAALLIYNALKAETVTYVGTSAIDNGETLLGNIFGIEAVTGVVVANEYANLFGAEPLRSGYTEIALIGSHYIDQDQAIDPDYVVTNVKEAADYAITFITELVKEYQKGTSAMTDKDLAKEIENALDSRTEVYDEQPGTSWLVEFNRREATGSWDEYNTLIFKKSTDLAQVGETVTVYAKVDSNGDYTEAVVGNIITDDDCVVATYDGVDYENLSVKVDKNTRYFVNYAMAWDTKGEPSRYWQDSLADTVEFYNATKAITYNLPGETTKCVDVDGDGIVELVLKTRPVFTQANYDKYYDTWDFTGYYYGKDAVPESSIVSEKGFEDGDFVLVTYVDGTYYVEKADTVEGYVEKVSYTEEDYPYIVLENGDKYDESGIYWVGTEIEDCEDTAKGHTHFDGGDSTLYSYIANCNFDDEYTFYLDAQGNIIAYAPIAVERDSGKAALMTGSYIEGSKFEYALTYAGEEGVSIYDVYTNKYGDVEGSDADFFIEAGITDYDVNAGVLIGGTLFYKLSGYDTKVANHMAYIKAHGNDAVYALNMGDYGYGDETALVNITNKGDGITAGSILTSKTAFIGLADTAVKAGQYKFSGTYGVSGSDVDVYATSKTVFFVYEKVLQTVNNKEYYEVNVYSFTGYKNLPQYDKVTVTLANGDVTTFDGVTSAYAVINDKYEASYVVLEVATTGKTYAKDLALVLEKTEETSKYVTLKYLNAEGVLSSARFCKECTFENLDITSSKGLTYGRVYGIVECDDGYALVNYSDTLGDADSNFNDGFTTANIKSVAGGEYFVIGGQQYLTSDDTAYYGIVNVTTSDKSQTKAIVVKFTNYTYFSKAVNGTVGLLWTYETNKRTEYKQVNAVVGVVDDLLGYNDLYHFIGAYPGIAEVVSVIDVSAPVTLDSSDEAEAIVTTEDDIAEVEETIGD